uniref:Skp1_POZ domain-containing protein n=1 Tax=Panagrellus redivivus TaxID=6233 RepID=A0A7E4V9H8_PANRE
MFRLRANDDELFEVEGSLLKESKVLTSILEMNLTLEDEIPLTNIDGPTFRIVLDFFKLFVDDSSYEPPFHAACIKPSTFFKQEAIDLLTTYTTYGETMAAIASASSYLDSPRLMDYTAYVIATMAKDADLETLQIFFDVYGAGHDSDNSSEDSEVNGNEEAGESSQT